MKSYAVWYDKMPYTITQPDGNNITCFVTGDEFFNWIHDEKGFTIIQAPDGYYYYGQRIEEVVEPSVYLVNSVDPATVGLTPWAKISKAEYQRRKSVMQNYQSIGNQPPSKAPHNGTLNNLVIYIKFSDDTEFTTTRQVYDDRFNPSTGISLKSYFQEVSYSNLTISSTHYPACALTTNLSYQDTHPRNYFQPYNATTNPTGYNGDTERRNREHTLLVNAITWINANSPVSGSLNIDGDNDNRVDNVCFIVKGNSGGWSELLWAHRWALYSQTVYINGKRVYDYTFQPENQVSVKTLCHEMFHALGAPDLYHYDDGGLNIDPVGSWDLMESGFGHMTAYMKWKYSDNVWITNIPEITSSGTYTLNPLTSSSNNCFKIASPYSAYEYFIVEYRNKSGTFETNIPGSGLIVYRIDTRETGNASGPPDEVYIYRPGGSTTINGSLSTAHFSSTVGRTSINDATNPSSFLQNGSSGGLNISNVTAAGATISFTVTFPAPCTPPTVQAGNFTSSSITSTSMTIGWTRGNGTGGVLVIAKQGSIVDAGPLNGVTYSANNLFGSGTQLGSGNYVVYKGTGTSVNITGLTEGSTYHFAVYEYNSADYCYKTPALTGNATTTGYCTAGATATTYEYISNFVLGSINMASSRGTNGYQNFTSQGTATLQIGVNIAATISVTNPYSSDQILIWIDWNQDQDFSDAGENVYASSGTSFTTPHTTTSFSAPANALTGNTRMRVRLHDTGSGPNATPCGMATWGEVEDYTVNIVPACIPPPAPVVGNITHPTCILATGSVILSGLPATGSWTLTLSPGGIITTGTGTSTSISGLTSGTYTCTVTNASGCVSPSSANIVINPQPVTPATPIAGNNGPVCQGNTLTLTASTIAGATYLWTGANGFISTQQNPLVSNNASPVMAGIYSVTATANGCTSASAITTVTINPLPVLTTAANPSSICAGLSSLLDVSSNIPNTTFNWTPGNITGNNITVFPASTTNYTVTGMVNGCSAYSTVTVTVNQIPSAAATITGLQSVCVNQNNVIYNIPVIPDANIYLWTLPSGASGYSTSSSISVNYSDSVMSGDITVRGSNNCGEGLPSSISVSVHPDFHFDEYYSIFTGQSLLWKGNYYNAAGNYTVNYSTMTGCDSIFTMHLSEINPGPKPVSLKLFLESLYSGNGVMRQAQGGAGSQFQNGISDKVTVELRHSVYPYGVIYQNSNLELQTNGMLLINNLSSSVSGFYYLVIKHRNSIETWSAQPIDFSGPGPFSYDFSTAASQAYGNNQKAISGGYFAIYSGDINQDGNVDGSDIAGADNAVTNLLEGYFPEDVDGSGVVDGSDISVIDNNSSSVVGRKLP